MNIAMSWALLPPQPVPMIGASCKKVSEKVWLEIRKEV
jgi:hypothetical protein